MQVSEKIICPKCGGDVKVRQGRDGYFLGCIKYPKCKGRLETNEQEKDIIERMNAERQFELNEMSERAKGCELRRDNYFRILELAFGALLIKFGKPLEIENFKKGWDAISFDLEEEHLKDCFHRHAPMILFNKTENGLKITLVDEMRIPSISGQGEDNVDELWKTSLNERVEFPIIDGRG